MIKKIKLQIFNENGDAFFNFMKTMFETCAILFGKV